MTAPDYAGFLRQKIKMANFAGFRVELSALHECLYDHQRDIVRWAVLGGNRAIFAKFGLGKSVMQCEWLRQILMAAGGDGLIDRYSNPDELVYDPFCGLGTVPYRAILKGRRGGGSELNSTYFMDQVHYLKSAEREFSMPTLFDLEDAEVTA